MEKRAKDILTSCDDCSITEKLYQCCGRHPFTGEKAQLVLADGRVVTACPHLNANARCSIYETRPQGCREFVCDALKNDTNSMGPFRGFGFFP